MFPWYLLSSEKGFWGRQEGASMSSHLSACRASGDRQDGGSMARACCSLPGLRLWGSLVPAQTAPRLAQRAIVAGLEIRQARGKSFSFGEMEGLQIFNIETRWFIHVRQKKKPQMNSIAINITPGFQLLRVAAKYSEIQNKLKEQYFTQQIFTKSIQDTHHQENRKTISVFSNSLRAWVGTRGWRYPEPYTSNVRCQLYIITNYTNSSLEWAGCSLIWVGLSDQRAW